MLGQLHIKNIGIIEDISINFEDGLNILTGETGAGKSLIIDSINAITGSRISKEMIKTGEDMALVEACFFTHEENIILTREIYQNGRNICKINGKMVTLGELKDTGGLLIDIHGQHDNQSLLNAKTHLLLLDSFAGDKLLKMKEEYQVLLGSFKDIKTKIEENYGDPSDRAKRIDFLRYQFDEIQNSRLNIGEEEELSNRRNILMNAEKIVQCLNNSYSTLNDYILEKLGYTLSELQNISDIDSKYKKVLDSLEESYYSIQENNSSLLDYLNDVEFDENEQKEIEERLDLIFALKRKYGNSIEEIINNKENIKKQLDYLENSEEITLKLKEELSSIENDLKKLALKIRDIRKVVAKEIEEKINSQLQDLEMKKAFIKINFNELTDFSINGLDDIQMLISTNVGEGLKPLVKIASGGEISRVMLAIKTILCEYDNIPTMIFDEIDTGISGQAGMAVAEKLKIISKTHQVICVTHLPAICAAGKTNFHIEKNEENGKTKTYVEKLKQDAIIKEIARILAGKEITQTVLQHAQELRQRLSN
jgi:DNA repair protein RecN (Recombination protein N)